LRISTTLIYIFNGTFFYAVRASHVEFRNKEFVT
jgi:hypothetical protein